MADTLSIKELMKEYDLEIDDIRWHLSFIKAQQLLSYSDNIYELVHLLWSGKLADSLHDMEELYLESLQGDMDRDLIDETGVREIFADAYAQKNRRRWKNGRGL